MKMLLGFIFSLGMAGLSLLKMKTYGKQNSIIACIMFLIASVIFLGQFFSRGNVINYF